MKLFLCVLALLANVSSYAASFVFDFSYDTSVGLLSGQLDGELLPDGNTVIVTGMHNVLDFDAASILFSSATVGGVVGGFGIVTLDGTVMNFLTSSSASGSSVYLSFFTPGVGGAGGAPVFEASFLAPGGLLYVPTDWTMSFAAVSLPVPGSLPLVATALAGLLLLQHRRRAA